MIVGASYSCGDSRGLGANAGRAHGGVFGREASGSSDGRSDGRVVTIVGISGRDDSNKSEGDGSVLHLELLTSVLIVKSDCAKCKAIGNMR